MSKVSFTWSVSDPDAEGLVFVREKLDGTDLVNEYGPLPARIVESFVRARRDVVGRFMSKHDALRIFEPRPNLAALAALQRKPRYEN